MIQVISILQEKEWKKYVQDASKYDFYHTWHYNNIAKEGEPVLFVYKEGDNFIAFPLLKREIPNSYLFDMTSVYGYSGPLSNQPFENLSQKMKNNFKKEFLNYLRKNNYVSVFSRLHPFFNQLALMGEFEGVFDNGKIVVINLLESLEDQQFKYKNGLRLAIRKLKKQGFYVKEATSDTDIKEFANIYTENMKRVGATNFYMFSEKYFQKMLNTTDFESKLILVYHHNIIVCGKLITYTQNIIQSHLLATKTEYLRYSPAKLLIDEISILGRTLGMHYFNLGGGVGFKEDSLFDFKASFSDYFLTYKSWRYVVDEQKNQQLLEEAHLDPKLEVDFFPLYRHKKIE